MLDKMNFNQTIFGLRVVLKREDYCILIVGSFLVDIYCSTIGYDNRFPQFIVRIESSEEKSIEL